MALKAYMRIAAEERAWAYHLSTDRAEADYRNGLILAEERVRKETARNMLARNDPVTDIAEITGLPLAEVEKLAVSLKVSQSS